MSKTEVILISQFPLPYTKIASWTTMYNYLLNTNSHIFDHIICPKIKEKASNVTYHILRDVSLLDKIKSKLITTEKRYANYIEALDLIIKPDTKYILHIIDNSGIVLPIHSHLKEKYKRRDFYIQYYYQGFAPLFSRKRGQPFLYAIDELFFLTHLSYKEHLGYYDDCTFKARVLPNAANSSKFTTISADEKLRFRELNKIKSDVTVFMWCSQDREKKGLHIVLEAFSKVYSKNKKTKLLIVGINREINQDGVTVIGRVPNDELPRYYQMSDVYLFPSLWKEGFGIVLAEALKCGCYCIASSQGGIPEVLNYGHYGVLIENPNFIDDWVFEMLKVIDVLKGANKNPYIENIPKNVYDIEEWRKNINFCIEEAKLSLNLELK